MKKTLIAFLLAVSLLLSVFSFTSCEKKQENSDPALMTVDINPSVEFVLDGENKVVSATALNDDGAVILSGEVFVGLTAEEAAKKVVSISIETGYLSKEDAKGITLTLTGAEADQIYQQVSEKVAGFAKEHGIDSAVKQGKALAESELKALLLASDPTLTEEDVANLSAEEVVTKLGEARKEYAAMATEELRDAYLKFKESKISIAEKEATVATIEALGSSYDSFLTSYRASLEKIDGAAKAINDLYYEKFLAEDSDYQKATAQVKTARVQLVAVKNAQNAEELNTVLADEGFDRIPGIASARTALDAAVKLGEIAPSAVQTAYDTAMATVVPLLDTALTSAQNSLETVGSLAKIAVNAAIDALNESKTKLSELESTFPADLKAELAAKASEMEKAANDAKDAAFAEFEKNYSETIARTNEEIAAYKKSLKEAVQ